MKLSLRWLNDHVDLSGIEAEEIADQLTRKIALIEAIERQGSGISQVLVGEVLERSAHPDADRLSVCKVATGVETVQVVCGAANVAAGQKIAFAPVGSTLPGGLKLEKRKLRGVLSHGMICSAKELELNDDHEGILVLDPRSVVGQRVVEVLGLDDVLLEIDNKTVTHRADLWGHYGFARELAAIFGRSLRPLEFDRSLRADPSAFPVEIQDRDGCSVYLGLMVDDASGGRPSPDWLARRLQAVGMRSLDLLVDLSNYVMLELGQPTHPFDRDRLRGGVVVRRAEPGERLETLDGVQRRLGAEDLMIADRERPLAIAGIMGGSSSEVTAETQRVLLESAHFDAIRVRRTSSRLGLRTDALSRFEKFLDPCLAELALRRYSSLLKRCMPEAKVLPLFAAAGEAKVERARILLRPDRARSKLGFSLPTTEMAELLRSIEFEVHSSAVAEGEVLEVVAPTFRSGRDVQHEDDLIEEVGRLAGFERVPAVLPRVVCDPPRLDPLRRIEREAVLALVRECAFTETVNYSFATDRHVERYHDTEEPFLCLPHPLTQDASRLRRSLVPGLLEQVAKNQVLRDEIRMVEVGRAYLREHGEAPLPAERRELVAVRTSASVDAESLVLDLRSDVESLMRRVRRPWTGGAPSTLPRFAHPGRCVEIQCEERVCGFCCELHPELRRRFELSGSVALLWLDLGALVAHPEQVVRMTPLPQFPAVRRDLSVLVDDDLSWQSIRDVVQSAEPRFLVAVELFDLYRGPGVPEGKRSLAFRLEYRAPDRTLTDKEVESMQSAVLAALSSAGVVQRS